MYTKVSLGERRGNLKRMKRGFIYVAALLLSCLISAVRIISRYFSLLLVSMRLVTFSIYVFYYSISMLLYRKAVLARLRVLDEEGLAHKVNLEFDLVIRCLNAWRRKAASTRLSEISARG
jgi:hypothetical protein